MTEKLMRYLPPALRDENVLRVKARIINIIAPELQKLPSTQLNRQNVRLGLEKSQ